MKKMSESDKFIFIDFLNIPESKLEILHVKSTKPYLKKTK